jgi:hypothetical protein
MRIRRVLERTVRWGVTAGFLASVAAMVFSSWWCCCLSWSNFASTPFRSVVLNNGNGMYQQGGVILVNGTPFSIFSCHLREGRLVLEYALRDGDSLIDGYTLFSSVYGRMGAWKWVDWPWVDNEMIPAPIGGRTFQLPLWVISLTFLCPSLVMWKRKLGPKRGHCRCGYSLIGLTATKCPECGRALLNEPRA